MKADDSCNCISLNEISCKDTACSPTHTHITHLASVECDCIKQALSVDDSMTVSLEGSKASSLQWFSHKWLTTE